MPWSAEMKIRLDTIYYQCHCEGAAWRRLKQSCGFMQMHVYWLREIATRASFARNDTD